jgi:hypothetical protein
VIIKYYTMKTKGGAGADPQLLTSALDGGEWSASRAGRYTSRNEHPVPTG